MSTNPLGNPKVRYLTSTGAPLSGGLLYSYAAGTTTQLATYTTRAGDVANSNPVVLDANGEADVWMTPATGYKFVLKNSAGVTQWTVDNYPSADTTNTGGIAVDPGGRLTLNTSEPLTTADESGSATLYYLPYKHDRVPLYDGSVWSLHSIGSGLSQAVSDTAKSPAAGAANKIYDMFVWYDAGTLRLSRGPAWSSDTSRGTGAGTTEIERVSGRYVNKVSITNGPAAQRGLYVGTVRTDGLTFFVDTGAKRYCWNAYNRARRWMVKVDGTGSWTYATATWRQANNSVANQLDLVVGLSEDVVTARVRLKGKNSSTSTSTMAVGIALDNVTGTFTSGQSAMAEAEPGVAASGYPLCAEFSGLVGVGRHYLAWLEKAIGAGTTTFYGGSADPSITGECLA